MRRLRFCALAFLAACGSEIGDGGDGGTDGSTDGLASDASSDAIQGDATGGDAGNDAVASDATPPVQLHLKCAEGSDCDAAASVCCATLDFGSDCVLDSVTSACAAAAGCPTTLQPFCAQTETVRFCDQNADCTEPSYDRCCTFWITGHPQQVVMCANQQMADAVDASCVP